MTCPPIEPLRSLHFESGLEVLSADRFEAYSLAASIVGKCHFCVKAHYDTLKKNGYTVEQLRDIGRIASVINSVAKVLNS